MKTILTIMLAGFAGFLVQPSIIDAAEAKGLRAKKENLYRHVDYLASIGGYRHYANYIGLRRCIDYICAEFGTTNGRVALQNFRVQDGSYQNIICSMGPERGPRIIVGAHYDVCGPQPGADDNASAVAGLLEIARMIGSRQHQLKYRLDLVAYCLEEPPFFGTENMGSYHHARSMRDQKSAVMEMICLEMIGFFAETENSQQFPFPMMKWIYPNKANFIAVIGNLRNWRLVRQVQANMRRGANIEVCKLSAPTLIPGVGLSDHSSYWKFGFPAVMVSDTAFYRNPNYHLPSDTIGTLDFVKMAEVVNAVAYHLMVRQSE